MVVGSPAPAAATSAGAGLVEVVAGLVVVGLFKAVELVIGLVEALSAVEDACGEGFDDVVAARIVVVVGGGVVAGSVTAT